MCACLCVCVRVHFGGRGGGIRAAFNTNVLELHTMLFGFRGGSRCLGVKLKRIVTFSANGLLQNLLVNGHSHTHTRTRTRTR